MSPWSFRVRRTDGPGRVVAVQERDGWCSVFGVNGWEIVLVALIAGAGGLMSLFHFHEVLGSRLEFVATTMAIGWLIVFGLVTAVRAFRLGVASPAESEALAVEQLEQAIG